MQKKTAGNATKFNLFSKSWFPKIKFFNSNRNGFPVIYYYFNVKEMIFNDAGNRIKKQRVARERERG